MITATISVPDKEDHVRRVFAAEQQELLNERASYSVAHEDGVATVTVEAKDATALRAVVNSVCKVLITYEKTAEVVDDDR
ncbi:MAG: KEOPS complex subunit Pcc1 [Candidatus Woesearchaeota archaeon]